MNGQAKIDFEKWFFEYYNKDKTSVAMFNHEAMFNNFQEIVKQAYIISWFDSVGIYINTSGLTLSKTFIVDISVNSNCEFNFDGFTSRQQATEKALEKAVELYNLKFKENE